MFVCFIHRYVYTCIYIYIYIYLCVYVCIYTYTYTSIYTRTYIHVYCVCVCVCVFCRKESSIIIPVPSRHEVEDSEAGEPGMNAVMLANAQMEAPRWSREWIGGSCNIT